MATNRLIPHPLSGEVQTGDGLPSTALPTIPGRCMWCGPPTVRRQYWKASQPGGSGPPRCWIMSPGARLSGGWPVRCRCTCAGPLPRRSKSTRQRGRARLAVHANRRGGRHFYYRTITGAAVFAASREERSADQRAAPDQVAPPGGTSCARRNVICRLMTTCQDASWRSVTA